MIRIETKHTIIQDQFIDDLDTHHELFSNKEVMFSLNDILTKSIEESKENLIKVINEIGNPNRTLYFLRTNNKNNDEHIGEIEYTVTKVTPVGKFVAIGYFIRTECWR